MKSAKRAPKSILHRMMDLLARRPHSSFELRQKLLRHGPADEVEKAILKAREENWLESEEVLSSRFSKELSRKGKGHFQIQNQLKKRGLPNTRFQANDEVKSAVETLLKQRFFMPFFDLETHRIQWPSDFEEKQQLMLKTLRFLRNRGFHNSTIQAILKNTDFGGDHVDAE